MKTITLTDEQELFINGLAEQMETQSCRNTQYPLFYVYQKDFSPVEEHDGWDKKERNPDGYCDDCAEIGDSDLPDDCHHCDWVYLKVEDVPAVDVGPFLTEQAAQQHIASNGYHYTKPYIYVNSAWRNYEMQGLLQLLFALAGKEVPSQYK